VVCGKGGNSALEDFPGIKDLKEYTLLEQEENAERFDRPLIRRGGKEGSAPRPIFNDPKRLNTFNASLREGRLTSIIWASSLSPGSLLPGTR